MTPLLITGLNGTVGSAFARICDERGLPWVGATRAELDIASPRAAVDVLSRASPWAVVNAAGYVRVDDGEREGERCYRENSDGAAVLARACAQLGLPLVTFSSDLIFDGMKRAPYVESDRTGPLSVYGHSKVQAERRVLAANPRALIARTSALFGPWDEANFVTAALRRLRRGEPVVAASETRVSPTYVPDLVHTCLDLLIDGEHGIWHLSNQGEVSWAELAREASRLAGVDPSGIDACPSAGAGWVAQRPLYSVLGSERATLLPHLDDALRRYTEGSTVAA